MVLSNLTISPRGRERAPSDPPVEGQYVVIQKINKDPLDRDSVLNINEVDLTFLDNLQIHSQLGNIL